MEKYKFLSGNNNNEKSDSGRKTNLSMAGVRIDERGGIYLCPLIDSNTAYFK